MYVKKYDRIFILGISFVQEIIILKMVDLFWPNIQYILF